MQLLLAILGRSVNVLRRMPFTCMAHLTRSDPAGLGKADTYTSYVMRGWSYHQLGQVDDAFRDFDLAVSLDPTRVLGWYSRGMAHKRLGRTREGKEDCDHAVDMTWEDLARASLEDFGLPPLGVEEQMCDVPEGIRVFFTQLAGAVIGDEVRFQPAYNCIYQ